MTQEPDKLIEINGYVYKLLQSKEEQLKRDERQEKKRIANLGAFQQKIGSDLYRFLKSDNAVVKYHNGGNYWTNHYYDFGADQYWWEDEYTTSEKVNFGAVKDWYGYNDGDFRSNFVDATIYKAIADYLFEILQPTNN